MIKTDVKKYFILLDRVLGLDIIRDNEKLRSQEMNLWLQVSLYPAWIPDFYIYVEAYEAHSSGYFNVLVM